MYCPGYYFFSFNFETHTHPGLVYVWKQKVWKNCFLKLMFLFYCWFLTVFGDEGRGCLLFKNPCVFFSKKCM